jgi:integrase
MYQRRQSRVPRIVFGPWLHEFEPGLHTLPDGRTVMATERDLTFSDGTRRPNGHPGVGLVGADLPAAEEFKALDDAWNEVMEGKWNGTAERPIKTERPVLTKPSADDAILETYIKHNGITGYREREAREMWRIFRTVVDKPLRSCTREDGRAVVAYLEDEAEGEVKSATLRRRMVPLVAAVNLAIDEGKLTFNPFSAVVADRKDEDERSPFDDDDVKKIRANLHKLDKADQLLLRVLATTGMRRGEAFEIASEKTEDGIRYCEVGTKTPQSRRRVPFPKALLPHLPKKITGPLFTGRKDTASKRLREFMRDIGITDPDKAPMHSFRHRAANRLRRAGVPEDLREAIGGWADGKKKTSRKYGNKHGRGFPIKMLKTAIDKIGF